MTSQNGPRLTSVAVVHDYFCERAGGERVALSLFRAFPAARMYTALYNPDRTYPELAAIDLTTSALNRVPALRRSHRRALPLLPAAYSRLPVDADITICSSAGWSHGARARGRKIVFWHSAAKWLHQRNRYRGGGMRGGAAALAVLRPYLTRWDRAAVATIHRHLTLSTFMRDQLLAVYGVRAEIIPPPPTLGANGPQRPVQGIEPGYVLCVSRLLPYKNVQSVVRAFVGLPGQRLVVAGTGPQEAQVRALGSSNVTMIGSVSDEELRWLYANCAGLVAAAREDYGLTPLEAASFGKPVAVLRWGGFLDTVQEGRTGVFFDAPEPAAIHAAVQELLAAGWSSAAIRAHAAEYSEARFAARIREVVAEELAERHSSM